MLEMAEVEETLKGLQSQKGVPGIIVFANLMHNFTLKAQSTVHEIDPRNDLTFLQIHKDCFLIVIQNPTE
ncbi:unnamed protein product [Nyctereutes procyonoides]|uniref:(raccoon dog) hypothetical protein n=1 Tax=Nyctereutes procyonoides TaxID=34880 RepID=A0A811ZHT3_NYCPR|nr:unnamed protein product [Nyctereutes procyonoides]